MQIVGITGGIGSGKTTVCKIFQTLGIPVYYADERAKMLMQEDEMVIESIISLFGKDAYTADGTLNRTFISEEVFNDSNKLEKLNAIVHPATIRDSLAWAEKQSAAYVLKEAALLFESKAFHHVNFVIGVSAPEPLRIHRTMRRSHLSREEVLARMKKQIDEEIKMKLSDFVIINDEQHALIPQVLQIHKKLTHTSHRRKQ